MLSTIGRSSFYIMLLMAIQTNCVIIDLKSYEQLNKEVSTTKMPLIVLFEADWCGVCKNIQTPFEQVMHESEFVNIKAIRINIDKFPELIQKYNIEGIPTFKFFASGGADVGTTMGIQNLHNFKDNLRQDLRTKFKKTSAVSPQESASKTQAQTPSAKAEKSEQPEEALMVQDNDTAENEGVQEAIEQSEEKVQGAPAEVAKSESGFFVSMWNVVMEFFKKIIYFIKNSFSMN